MEYSSNEGRGVYLHTIVDRGGVVLSVLGSVDREDVRLINRVVITNRFRSMRVRGQPSPLSLLCITMILRVRRKILKLIRSPNSGIRARF